MIFFFFILFFNALVGFPLHHLAEGISDSHISGEDYL